MRTDILDSFWLLLSDKGESLVLCLAPRTPFWWGNRQGIREVYFHRYIILSQPYSHILDGNAVFFLVFCSSRVDIVKIFLCCDKDPPLFFLQYFGFSHGFFFFFWSVLIGGSRLNAFPPLHLFYMFIKRKPKEFIILQVLISLYFSFYISEFLFVCCVMSRMF